MKVSIVIPAFNEEKLLGGTLASVSTASEAFARRGWDVEVLVCDNNSTDRTASIARAAGAQVVFEPVNQIGRARNTGAAAATGDWLVFVDADSSPSTALFDAVAREIQSGRVIAGGSTVRLDGGGWTLRMLVEAWNVVSRCLGWMAGSFIFVERAAFESLGGFSPLLFAAEEIDLSKRLKPLARQSGRRLRIVSEAPLLTSARKEHLYTPAELIRFTLRGLIRPRSTVQSREACSPWYDGRR
ncbi:MAG: glycosyltransferase [Verrucomicrobia bacterium]|nr:glycosyltransferase [Verrucomicrobiota bacterium]